MKRPYSYPYTMRPHTKAAIRDNLSEQQLLALGLVTFTYNYAEAAINRMVGPAINLFPQYRNQVVSRINGIDGRIELVKLGASLIGLPEDILQHLREAVGEGSFMRLRRYRDAVVHARIIDSDLGLGEIIERRGRHSEVLMTADALNGLADHMEALAYELSAHLIVLMRARSLRRIRPDLTPSEADQVRERYEQEIQAAFAQAQEHRSRRLSLPPLPEFPEEPQNHEGS